MQLAIDFEQGELLCPHCGGNYVHHGAVEVFNCKEDANEGLHVRIEGDSLTADRNLKGNPSSRRHGLRIALWCESCKGNSYLTIAQHKGNTLFDVAPDNNGKE